MSDECRTCNQSTDTILNAIGDLKGDIGGIKSDIQALSGPNGRVTVIEQRLDKQDTWSKIQSLAIVVIPPFAHKGLAAITKFFA